MQPNCTKEKTMSEPISWRIRAIGREESVRAFADILKNTKKNKENEGNGNPERLPEIRGMYYHSLPVIKQPVLIGSVWAVDARGSSWTSPDVMLTAADDSYIISLPEAAKRFHVDIEMLASDWATYDAYDYHILIDSNGCVLVNDAKPALHEHLDTFEDTDELMEAATEPLIAIGLEPTSKNAMKFLDEDGDFISISALPQIFTIPDKG